MKRYLFLTVTLVLFFSLAVNAFAATYYVAPPPTGSNNNPGTEYQPWATLTYAESKLSSGDTVIVRGGIYHEAITINVANVTFQNYPGESPIIDGQNTLPAGDNSSLVLMSANEITLDGFEIRNGYEGRGITIYSVDNCNILNCLVHHIQSAGIIIWNGADYAVIEDSEIHHHNMNHVGGTNRPWGAGLNILESSNATFRRLKVHEGHGEGIIVGRGSRDVVVEQCTVYDNRAVQIYCMWSTNVTIKYNLIYGTNNSEFHRYPGAAGHGIVIAKESWYSGNPATQGRNFKIYGNLVAGTFGGIQLWGDSAAMPEAKVYNNAVVESHSSDNSHICFKVGNAYTDHIVKNNIFLQTNGTIASVPSSGTYANNLWSKTPEADAQGVGDVIGDPQLTKTSGWDSITAESLDGSEFALQSTSPAIDAGTPFGLEVNHIPECNKSVWLAQIVLMDQDKQGSGWEIGADIYDVANPTALDSPTNLRIAAGQ
jgi:Right handed beta helix region